MDYEREDLFWNYSANGKWTECVQHVAKMGGRQQTTTGKRRRRDGKQRLVESSNRTDKRVLQNKKITRFVNSIEMPFFFLHIYSLPGHEECARCTWYAVVEHIVFNLNYAVANKLNGTTKRKNLTKKYFSFFFLFFRILWTWTTLEDSLHVIIVKLLTSNYNEL